MAAEHDFEQHRRTWSGFVRFVRYSGLAAAIVLALMAIFLV